MKNRIILLNCLFLLAVSSFVVESNGQCNLTVQSSVSCSLPTVLTVSAGFPVGRIEWRLSGNLVRVDSATYPASGTLIAAASYPISVYLDSVGNIYLCEDGTHQVTKRGPGQATATVIAGVGYSGSALNQFYRPQNCIVSKDGYLYVADKSNNRIMRYPPNSTGGSSGVIIAGGNLQGNALNQFNEAIDLEFDANGDLYVADLNNHRVMKFAYNSANNTYAANGIIFAGGNGVGTALNQFTPGSIHITPDGNVYVSDLENRRILRFPSNATQTTMGVVVAGDGLGSTLNKFADPGSIFVDKLGYLYVADKSHPSFANQRIVRFPPNSTSATMGVVVAGGNGSGAGLNQLNAPTGIYVSDSGHLFTSEYTNARVMKYKASIRDTFTAAVAGTYQVKVYGFNGCVATETVVVGSGGPTFTPGTNPTVCLGGTSTTLVLNNITGSPDEYSIIWNGAAQTAGFSNVTNNLSGSSVNIPVPGSAVATTYSGTITLRNSTTGCASTPANISVVVSVNGPTFTPGSNPSVCVGSTNAVFTFSGAAGSPDRYSIAWNTAAQTAGFTNMTAQPLSGNSINISVPSSITPATYTGTLTMSNSTSGCVSASSNISVVVHALPVATVTPAGPVEVCVGQTETLTAGSGTGYNYQWKDAQGVVGSGGSYNAGATGDYYVVVTDGNNCKDSSAPVSVTQFALPQVSITPGDTAFCAGGFVRLETATSDTGLSYQWKKDNNQISAMADFLEVNSTGVYSVLVTRNSVAGCTDSAPDVQVTVHPLPAPPVNWDGTILTTEGYYDTYQWLISGQPIAAATSASFLPDTTGSYSVMVTDSNGCSNTSSSYQVNELPSGVKDIKAQDIAIYPNPVAKQVYISGPAEIRVMLRGMDGRLLYRMEKSGMIDISAIPEGIYLLQVYNADGLLLKNERLVKSSN